MTRRLENKVCIITGSGGSMGRAAALHFAREGALVVGCDLAPDLDRETHEGVLAAGGQMACDQPRDLTDPDACRALAEFAVKTYGRIDVLYNNAAGGRFHRVEEMPAADWRATMAEELDIVFFMCQAAWPHLKVRGGAIINTASMSGKIGIAALPQVAHSAGKAGVIGMTRQLAVEGGPFGIRANSISPGLIETNKTRPLIAQDAWRQAMVAKIMLGRPGEADEVALAALFLASDEASFITGADLAIDVGACAW